MPLSFAGTPFTSSIDVGQAIPNGPLLVPTASSYLAQGGGAHALP